MRPRPSSHSLCGDDQNGVEKSATGTDEWTAPIWTPRLSRGAVAALALADHGVSLSTHRAVVIQPSAALEAPMAEEAHIERVVVMSAGRADFA